MPCHAIQSSETETSSQSSEMPNGMWEFFSEYKSLLSHLFAPYFTIIYDLIVMPMVTLMIAVTPVAIEVNEFT